MNRLNSFSGICSRYVIVLLSMFLVSHVQPLLYGKESPPVFEYTRYYDPFQIKDRGEGTHYDELEAQINSMNPNLGADAYYEFEIPESLLSGRTEEEIDAHLYDALLSFHSQEGIEYFSHRRQEYRVFIEKSNRVGSLEDKSPLADLRISDTGLLSTQIMYVYQEDSSFGNSVRQVDIAYDDNTHLWFINISNKEKIYYQGVIKIANPDTFVMKLLIKRNGNKMSIYGISAVHVNTFGFLRKRMSISMAYRIYALAQWFEHRVLQDTGTP